MNRDEYNWELKCQAEQEKHAIDEMEDGYYWVRNLEPFANGDKWAVLWVYDKYCYTCCRQFHINRIFVEYSIVHPIKIQNPDYNLNDIITRAIT